MPREPTPAQARIFARVFGCARVVYNDALLARREAHNAGLPYISDAELPARLTAAKATPERAWLGEVSSVVLQQSLADLNAAYKNFFASISGDRQGPKIGPPRLKTRKARARLAKSVHDAGWAAFTRMLEYKSVRYGRVFRKIGRFEPTSQRCSTCGVTDGPKPLHIRQWTCVACGTVLDRDLNAARNIVALGRRETQNACGGDVRRETDSAIASEAGTLRGAA
jgi:transposase